MLNKKKGLAMLLAATMVVGSAFPVLAAEQPTSGGATGAGDSEGHLEKKITNVVLPTDGDTSVFKYNIDPERLIQETEGAKYENTIFPDKDADTGVYFAVDLTEEETTAGKTTKYANTSKELVVTNKSSHKINLTVKAKASQAVTDIALANSSTIEGDTPQLYLGLTVGSETKAISTTDVVFTAEIEGKADNFVTKVENGAYKYAEKDGATGWSETKISMAGKCNEATTTSAMTVPTVTITWEFTDPTAAPAVQNPSISGDGLSEDAAGQGWDYTANFTKGTDLVFTVDFGNQGATAISSTGVGPAIDSIAANASIISASGNTVTIAGASWAAAGSGSIRYGKITLDDGTEFIVKLTIS